MQRLIWDFERKPVEEGPAMDQWEKDGVTYLYGYRWLCIFDGSKRAINADIEVDIPHPDIITRIGNSGDFLQSSCEELKHMIRECIGRMQLQGSQTNDGDNQRLLSISAACWKWAGKKLIGDLGFDITDWDAKGQCFQFKWKTIH